MTWNSTLHNLFSSFNEETVHTKFGSAQHCGAQARLHFVEFYSVYLNENLKYYDVLKAKQNSYKPEDNNHLYLNTGICGYHWFLVGEGKSL